YSLTGNSIYFRLYANSPVTLHVPISLFYFFLINKATLANRPTGNIVSSYVSPTAKPCLICFWLSESLVTLHVPISLFYFFLMNKATLANRPAGNIVSRHVSQNCETLPDQFLPSQLVRHSSCSHFTIPLLLYK
ncbi:hypothetical protein J6590_104296, partial [Homalodisca vitripennis]